MRVWLTMMNAAIAIILLMNVGCRFTDYSSYRKRDKVRQSNIKHDYERDDFTFDKFNEIDWAVQSSFGADCSPACFTLTHDSLDPNLVIPEIGLTDANY